MKKILFLLAVALVAVYAMAKHSPASISQLQYYEADTCEVDSVAVDYAWDGEVVVCVDTVCADSAFYPTPSLPQKVTLKELMDGLVDIPIGWCCMAVFRTEFPTCAKLNCGMGLFWYNEDGSEEPLMGTLIINDGSSSGSFSYNGSLETEGDEVSALFINADNYNGYYSGTVKPTPDGGYEITGNASTYIFGDLEFRSVLVDIIWETI